MEFYNLKQLFEQVVDIQLEVDIVELMCSQMLVERLE
jgi:hypothetical protein